MHQPTPEKAMQHDDYRTEMPQDWKAGYRAAMNDAASVARELHRNHAHHTGADGLLLRCLEVEQLFLGDAEKMRDC